MKIKIGMDWKSPREELPQPYSNVFILTSDLMNGTACEAGRIEQAYRRGHTWTHCGGSVNTESIAAWAYPPTRNEVSAAIKRAKAAEPKLTAYDVTIFSDGVLISGETVRIASGRCGRRAATAITKEIAIGSKILDGKVVDAKLVRKTDIGTYLFDLMSEDAVTPAVVTIHRHKDTPTEKGDDNA